MPSIPFSHNKVKQGTEEWQENDNKDPNKFSFSPVVVLEHMKKRKRR